MLELMRQAKERIEADLAKTENEFLRRQWLARLHEMELEYPELFGKEGVWND